MAVRRQLVHKLLENGHELQRRQLLMQLLLSDNVQQRRAGFEECERAFFLGTKWASGWETFRRQLNRAKGREENERVREAKRRGGQQKDRIRRAILDRIVKLLQESDEIETTREVWNCLRGGKRRIGRDLTIEFDPDLDVIADKFQGRERMIITSLTGPVKIVTFQTFRTYVREAREILQQPAR